MVLGKIAARAIAFAALVVALVGVDVGVAFASLGAVEGAALPLPEVDLVRPEAPRERTRPAVTAEPRGAADRVTAPRALVTPALVSATVEAGHQQLPLVVPDSALPWRFAIDRALAARFGERAAYDAVRQWDGIPGSRWATLYTGLVEAPGEAAADGRSVVFAQPDCPTGVAGYAYWQTGNAVIDARYGDAAAYVTEVDVAVCDAVTDAAALRLTVAHELGHAFGLEHLCEPTEPCWQPGMASGSHRCRLMYAYATSCRPLVTAGEQVAALHLYPRLERLAGTTRIETAARASYAAIERGSAPLVVLARADETAHGPLAGAALAGALGAPLLLGVPDEEACVTGATAEELARAAADPGGVVLIGDWPAVCSGILQGWGLTASQVAGATPVELGLAVAQELADSGRMGDAVFVVAAAADGGGHVPDGVSGGAAAGTLRGPVLFTGAERLSESVQAWLQGHPGVRRAYVLGGQRALGEGVEQDLRALGLDVARVAGPDRVATAVALAARGEIFPGTRGPVVVAAAESWADAVTGSAVGARLGAPVLVTPPMPHPQVEAFLAQRDAARGYLVGGAAALPYELQWAYTRLVG
jgi:hypothetical protein